MKMLLVGGDFGPTPRPSGYFHKLYEAIQQQLTDAFGISFYNGGSFEQLEELLDRADEFSVILWFANVPNDKAKIVKQLKILAPNAILVTSKNNLDNKYSYQEVIARALAVKANLCLVFTLGIAAGQEAQPVSKKILGTLIDPLGNSFGNIAEENLHSIAGVLLRRVEQLQGFTRVGGKCVGPGVSVPDEPAFFAIAQQRAQEFHELIHAHDTTRFLGNLSFRCEKGFPSCRAPGGVFVSRRNVDKRDISTEGMVFVEEALVEGKVAYHGENKPSVDTPIQLELYRRFPHINYMIHSHVYVEGAPFTKEKISCGAMEEVASICEVLQDPSQVFYTVNLLGHGSIVMASIPEMFKVVSYYSRELPEAEAL